MYRIINIDGTTIGYTDSPLYIKLSDSGSYTPTDAKNAEGVAYDSIPYSLVGHEPLSNAAGTAIVKEFDSGKLMKQIEDQEEIIDDILLLWAEEENISDKITARYMELYTEGKVTEDGLVKVMGKDKAEDIIDIVNNSTTESDENIAGEEAEVTP